MLTDVRLAQKYALPFDQYAADITRGREVLAQDVLTNSFTHSRIHSKLLHWMGF